MIQLLVHIVFVLLLVIVLVLVDVLVFVFRFVQDHFSTDCSGSFRGGDSNLSPGSCDGYLIEYYLNVV